MSGKTWQGRSVFVTGASGFIGSWLVKDLVARGANVSVLVRDADPRSELYRSGAIAKVSVVNGGLEDFWTVERAINEYEPEVVFHLAAQAIVQVARRFPMQTFEANVRGTWNVLEACRLHASLVKAVVVASSDKAYGTHKELPYTEESALRGTQPYEVSKSCADLITQSYHHSYGLPVTIARCGNVFGGGDLNWSRIVPSTIRSFLERSRPILRSDGRAIRDYIYVKDVASAYVALAEKISDPRVRGGAFNFSPESRVSVLELVDAIRKVMKCDDLEPDIRNDARGEIPAQYLSSAKAQEVLGWRAGWSLHEGLAETVEWYREFLGAPGGERR